MRENVRTLLSLITFLCDRNEEEKDLISVKVEGREKKEEGRGENDEELLFMSEKMDVMAVVG